MSNKNDVREIHGDEFAEGLDEQFGLDEQHDEDESNTEELTPTPSFRVRAITYLQDLLESRMAFWLAGFVDGIIIGLIIAYFRSR